MLRTAKALATQAVKFANIDIPVNVQVARQGDQLIFTGPLGVNRLGIGYRAAIIGRSQAQTYRTRFCAVGS